MGLNLLRFNDRPKQKTTFDHDLLSTIKITTDAANQISQITEPSSTRLFGYDNADRLTSVTGSTTESYVYDKVGNRDSSHLSSSYVNALFNRLTTTQTATYGYDANGSMMLKSEGKELWRYGWDAENKLTSASTRKTAVRYKYDALGRRVQRIVGSGKENTKFTYQGNDVLIDNNDGGTLTKYINGSGIDNKLRATTGSNTSYFVADHLGSTNGLTNASGALTASNSYDSFGNPTNASFPSRYQFTGREFDSFSGLQYSRARFYDPELGRFISEDPIGFAGGDVNLYGYVKNRPIQLRDPSGKFPVALAIVAGAFAAETALHLYLGNRAESMPWTGPNLGRQKEHCYVNCMSTRIHLGNSAVVTAGGLGQEAVNIAQYVRDENYELIKDSMLDLDANFKGQMRAIIIWRSCFELCDNCQ